VSTATSVQQAVVAFQQFIRGLSGLRDDDETFTGLSQRTRIAAIKLNRSEVLQVFLILNSKHEPHRAMLGKVGTDVVHLCNEFWQDAKSRADSIFEAGGV
jgi:hypothetical protein